ncbi:hypothetical protein BRADI_5g24696v3 [Brachypodium distachyon]|uniref:Uncharacterized protein n=1 Tax=Brachypodium distachyon TaxID=15368 RepID=A0A2K2CJ50_BRADI|nr:hypothetical protein BRADI_5g24696v3 [Brachypodium distachyon]
MDGNARTDRPYHHRLFLLQQLQELKQDKGNDAPSVSVYPQNGGKIQLAAWTGHCHWI